MRGGGDPLASSISHPSPRRRPFAPPDRTDRAHTFPRHLLPARPILRVVARVVIAHRIASRRPSSRAPPKDPPPPPRVGAPADAGRFRRCGGTYPDVFAGAGAPPPLVAFASRVARPGAGARADAFAAPAAPAAPPPPVAGVVAVVVVVVALAGGGRSALSGGRSVESAQSLIVRRRVSRVVVVVVDRRSSRARVGRSTGPSSARRGGFFHLQGERAGASFRSTDRPSRSIAVPFLSTGESIDRSIDGVVDRWVDGCVPPSHVWVTIGEYGPERTSMWCVGVCTPRAPRVMFGRSPWRFKRWKGAWMNE